MKDLLSDDGSLSSEEQLKSKVSRRGFLRLAAVAAGGSVAALA
ncbi:MAG: twin-arginine translocation signal domain-containing protein [Dehalococcoidia bacterium]